MGDEPAGVWVDSGTAFERMARGCSRPLLQFADFVLDDLSAAEDAMQDALVLARRQRNRLKDEGDARAWLRRMVLRECLRWRRHPIFRALALRDRVVAQAGSEATTQRDGATKVERLPPKARAAAFLHFHEGLTVAQVASELGMSASMVKTHLGTASDLGSAVRRYAAERTGRISENQAEAVVSRAARHWSQRRTVGRYIVNILSATTLALVIIAGGIVLQAQLHLFQTRAPSPTSSGPLPPIPNEIVSLINASGDSGLVIPFRLREGKPLSPRSQWIVAPGIAMQLTAAIDCSITTVSLIDPVSKKEVRPEVVLPDCNDTPVILPDGTVLLNHAQAPPAQYFRSGLGAIRYDWRAGRIIKQYPHLALPLGGALASKDGKLLYSLDAFSGDASRDTFLDFTDLESGARLVHVPVVLADSGGVAGGLALSTDQKILFVNQGYRLATFDAVSGAPGPTVSFSDGKTAARSDLPWWLPSIEDVEAQEGKGGHGLAVDPKGRWVAALGYTDPQLRGIWLIGASGPLPLLRRFYQSTALSDIAFSLDGSVLYAIDGTSLLVLDPQTGRVIKGFGYPASVGAHGIAGVQAQ